MVKNLDKVYIWKGSRKYEGTYLNNKRNGQGTLKYQNGVLIEGIWKDGKITDATITYPDKSQYKGKVIFDEI